MLSAESVTDSIPRRTKHLRARRLGATRWAYVVKFAGHSDKTQPEGELLKLAKEKEVKGISEYHYHEQITTDGILDSITNLRRNMTFGTPQAHMCESNLESSQLYSETSQKRKQGNTSESSTYTFQRTVVDSAASCKTEK